MIQKDLGSLILIQITTKKRTQKHKLNEKKKKHTTNRVIKGLEPCVVDISMTRNDDREMI